MTKELGRELCERKPRIGDDDPGYDDVLRTLALGNDGYGARCRCLWRERGAVRFLTRKCDKYRPGLHAARVVFDAGARHVKRRVTGYGDVFHLSRPRPQ